MTEKLKQTIKEEIEKLPMDLQNAINAVDWVRVCEQIGNSFSLDDSELNDFQVETLLVLARIQSLDFYAYNIETNVGTSKNQAEEIAREGFNKIFEPITNIFRENAKKNLSGKKTTVDQNLNFILSGGDYSVFIQDNKNKSETQTTDKLIGTSNILETKNKLLN